MEDEKLKKLLQPYKNLNKNRLDNYKNSVNLLTPAFKKQIEAAINAHPLRKASQAKKQTSSLIKKTRQHPIPVFLLTVYQTLVHKNRGRKITWKCVRREIEVNYENYLDGYFLEVNVEDDFFELLTSKKQKTTILNRLKWSSLPAKLTQMRKKFNVKI